MAGPTYRGNPNVSLGVDYVLTSGATSYSGSFTAADGKSDAGKEVVRTSIGDALSKIYYDVTEEKGTFTFVTTVSPFIPPAVGTLWSMTLGTSNKANAYWTGSNWVVENYDTKQSNTAAQLVTLDLSRNANIVS